MDNLQKCFIDAQIELKKAIACLESAKLLEYSRGIEMPGYSREELSERISEYNNIIKQIEDFLV